VKCGVNNFWIMPIVRPKERRDAEFFKELFFLFLSAPVHGRPVAGWHAPFVYGIVPLRNWRREAPRCLMAMELFYPSLLLTCRLKDIRKKIQAGQRPA
jgi:hypothetical protein